MSKKIRVNITVDSALLAKAKKKLNMFGGKLSTLFNAYLADFAKSIETPATDAHKILEGKIQELENRIKKIEDKKD